MFTVFDLDDTLSDTSHRQHILEEGDTTDSNTWNAFFDACDNDAPNHEIIAVFNALVTTPHNRIEIWTGRSDRVREKTLAWLQENCVEHADSVRLRMRSEGDYRHDSELKAEWVDHYGKPDLVFDDRNQMVQWWREQDVVCCQVKESDF